MSDQDLGGRLRGPLHDALDKYARARAERERRHAQPPRPGEVYVLPATAHLDVLWAVLEAEVGAPEILAVAADLDPLAGRADVPVPGDSAYGALTLRCGFEVQLGAAAFDGAQVSGFMARETVDQARRKRSEIERGSLLGSASQQEVDDELEYQDRMAVVARAQAALIESSGQRPAKVLDLHPGDEIFSGGIDGGTGEVLVPAMDLTRATTLARGENIDPAVLALVQHVHHVASQPHMGLASGADPDDLSQTGWAVVFHQAESTVVKDALSPLIEHRRALAGSAKSRVLEYRPGDDWRDWLARHGVAAGQSRPSKVPYYLLLVGPPSAIPYDFQLALGLEYAVGRLSFETPDDYRRYAESILDHDLSPRPPQSRTVASFAPRHPFDPTSRLTADLLVKPLIDGTAVTKSTPAIVGVGKARGFSTLRLWAADATRANLAELLHRRGGRGDDRGRPPALLFCASHGLGWPSGHPEQSAKQGSLLCQDWPGPGQIDTDHFFSARDLADDAAVHGTVALLRAAYAAGTPRRGLFPLETGAPPPPIADQPFVARLPQRLLAHPRGGALAVIGQIERDYGIVATETTQRVAPYRNTLDEILAGRPVGHAIKRLNQRFAARSTLLSSMVTKLRRGARVTDKEVATAWTERNETWSYVVLGDPAARLRVDVID